MVDELSRWARRLQMGFKHRQRELTLVADVEFEVDALRVGLDGAEGELHLFRDRRQLFAVKDVLDQLEFSPREPQGRPYARPIDLVLESQPRVVGQALVVQ